MTEVGPRLAGSSYFGVWFIGLTPSPTSQLLLEPNNHHRMAAHIPYESLRRIPLSYASCSIDGGSDSLQRKLDAIAGAGFTAIELSFPDILTYGAKIFDCEVSPYNFDKLKTVAAEIKKLVDANGLKVMMLQPFANFEGWPTGSVEWDDAVTRAKGWIEIMNVVDTNILQVALPVPPLPLRPSFCQYL